MVSKIPEKKNKRSPREFHISRECRDKYHFSETLFSLRGNVISTNFLAARTFAQRMNERRDLMNYPEKAVKSGQLIAMGLVDEILHYIAGLYIEENNAGLMQKALSSISKEIEESALEKVFYEFTAMFPPIQVYKREISVQMYLDGETGGVPNKHIILEEILLLRLANMNPAFSPFFELFDDSQFKKDTAYLKVVSLFKLFLEGQPFFGPRNQNLVDMLKSPAVAVPYSLGGQLEYIMEHWGYLLGKYFYRILRSLDLFREEEKTTFMGPGPAQVYKFKGLEAETEHFTPDQDWMPRLVLVAKNAYVWLDQLSKYYGRQISKLNEIPDDQLELLRRRGFSGLWLIGIWQRSPASQKIKQMCGNPEAVPSAYSLYDYRIADDLGGNESFFNLKQRAWERGIRLASDMVPNHVGITSRWVTEHPDWFVSLDQNPYPWYTYSGPDLSQDDRISIQIEDHYYDCTDAAVVFKRRDNLTGNEQYVYHGNDGTSMPWNDTAQLNYLNPEVREAMIRSILHVAKQSPVIRFDAAMTLTKKHYQRLWFPEPGTGGAIPTRAEHGISRSDFDRLMPNEFWREVVDRISKEAPDTLLLAEAFWLLEGYFVRTLGMHRVYNSAFMNMLRDEENGKYRSVMKNTLEFDPEILKRFVNFMSNPDERTAVDQFGKDNKYFGICTMMATLPGLPMFGHGQIEGFAEKYGMEYRRAYWDETPDNYLVERHEREIFPLLHKRYLFAGVEHFLLYDFYKSDGDVADDVFAFSNKCNDEKMLFIFNNANALVSGRIRTSVAYLAKSQHHTDKCPARKTLGDGLMIRGLQGHFTIFKDHTTHLEYIRENTSLTEQGLYVELGPYSYHTFLNFREVRDDESRHYSLVCSYLDGRGVPNIDESMQELFLLPIHNRFKDIINVSMFNKIAETGKTAIKKETFLFPDELADDLKARIRLLVQETNQLLQGTGDVAAVAEDIENKIHFAFYKRYNTAVQTYLRSVLHDELPEQSAAQFCWIIVHSLGRLIVNNNIAAEESRSLIDEVMLSSVFKGFFSELGLNEKDMWEGLSLIRIFTMHQNWFENMNKRTVYNILEPFMVDSEVQDFLQINRYKDILWFNRETSELLLNWMLFSATVNLLAAERSPDKDLTSTLPRLAEIIDNIRTASAGSNYQVELFIELVKEQERTVPVEIGNNQD